MEVRLSTLRAGQTLPPGRFVVLTFVRGSVDIRAGRIRLIERNSDLVGNRTRYLPACSMVPPLRYRVPPTLNWPVETVTRDRKCSLPLLQLRSCDCIDSSEDYKWWLINDRHEGSVSVHFTSFSQDCYICSVETESNTFQLGSDHCIMVLFSDRFIINAGVSVYRHPDSSAA
jgi:hypothetical protein